MIRLSRALHRFVLGKADVVRLLKPSRIILKITRLQRASRIRQLTVLSMIGVNPAAAFNRDWQREDILNADLEKLFELNTRALILDEPMSTGHAQLSPPEPPMESPHRREMERAQELI
jgi:hypothetical protein